MNRLINSSKNFKTAPGLLLKIAPLLLALVLFFTGTKAKAQCSADFQYRISGSYLYVYDSSSAAHGYTSEWSFGDGSSSHDLNAHHTYTSSGHYSLCHTIRDTVTNCTSRKCDSIYVSVACYSDFSMSASKLTVSFTNNSVSGYGYKSFWDFGDGHTSHDKNPSHTYAKDSTYEICLTITDTINNCSSKSCNKITVYHSCFASESHYSNGHQTTFTNSSVAEHSFTSSWNFGDGTSSHDKNPTHMYAKNGTYYVYLTINDSISNCSKTTVDTVRVYNACNAVLSYFLSGASVKFSDSGSYTAHAHTTLWSFGDGTYSHDEKPNHAYSSYGNFHVCLTVTDTVTKCSDTYCDDIFLKSCNAYFTYTVSGHTVTLIDRSTSLHPHIRSWRFSDGTTDSLTGDTVTHTFSSGSYVYVNLSITDTTSNCWSYYYAAIRLNSICNADFSYSTDNKKLRVRADSTNTKGTKYAWDFGDGTSGTGIDPSHTYSKYDTYTVCLTVSDSANNCSHKECKTITISEPTYCIYGQVLANSKPAYPCKVYLITYNATDSTVKSIDTFNITSRDSGSYYTFCHLHPDTYYVKAELDSPGTDWKHYVPTYYKDAVKWKKADSVIITNYDHYSVNINMHKGSNKGGPGFIAGKVTQGAGKNGDGLPGIEVMLLDADGYPTNYTFTDADGNYSFSNLALGTYTVYVEIPGVNMTGGAVSLTDAMPAQSNILIAVSRKEAHTYILETGNWQKENASVYPNPVNEKLVLQLNAGTTQQAGISVYNITGQMMLNIQSPVVKGQQFINIDTHTLPQGMYFLKVTLSKEQRLMETKFMKAE